MFETSNTTLPVLDITLTSLAAMTSSNQASTIPLKLVASGDVEDLWSATAGLLEEWYVACTSEELKVGEPLPVRILDRGIAMFRRTDGLAAAVLDQCVHRGSRLSAGKVQDGCLTCPYHGWRYNSEGQVAHIPSVDGIEVPEKPHNFKQRCFTTIEQDGVVWVYLGDQDPKNRPVFNPPFYNRPDFVSYYMVGVYNGDVGSVAQNIMDVSHTVFVHDKIFRSTAGKTLRSTIEVKRRAVEVLYHDTEASVGLMPWLTNPHRAPLLHTDKFFAPNITQVDYHWGDASGIVFNSLITPIDAHSSRVYTCVSYKFPLPRWVLVAMRPFVRVYTWIVNQQDMKAMLERHRGLQNYGGFKQHSVKADMAHVAIEKILASLRDRREMPASALGSRPMEFEI